MQGSLFVPDTPRDVYEQTEENEMGNQIVERTEAVNALLSTVKEHCMCAKFKDDGARFLVIYPCGMFPDGVQASYGNGKASALSRMLDAMEQHWNANGTT